jgi:hypothetical protein
MATSVLVRWDLWGQSYVIGQDAGVTGHTVNWHIENSLYKTSLRITLFLVVLT